MALFCKSVSVDADVDLDITVEEYYDNMEKSEIEAMANLMLEQGGFYLLELLTNDINSSYRISTKKRDRFYKDLPYHVGISDIEYLDQLIDDLKYYQRQNK